MMFSYSTLLAFATIAPSSAKLGLRGDVSLVRDLLDLQGSGYETTTACTGPDADFAYIPGDGLANPITIDGYLSDWSVELARGEGIPMYEAGNDGKTLASQAYVNYNCNNNQLCVLIMAEDGYYLEENNSNSWVRDYSMGASVLDYASGIQYVADPNNNQGKIKAWEACFVLDATCRTQMQLHANYGAFNYAAGNTTSTGKKSNYIAMDLGTRCGCENIEDCSSSVCKTATACKNDVCEYAEPPPGCCEDESDCKADEICSEGNQCISPDGGAGGCNEADLASCFLDTEFSNECAVAECSDDLSQCVFTPTQSDGSTCEENIIPQNDELEGNTCYLGNVCEGKSCVPNYDTEGATCGESLASGCILRQCVADGVTEGRTVCTDVNEDAGVFCNDGFQFKKGECDAGDQCDGAGVCNTHNYLGSDIVCRESVDCCDSPDVCSGNSHTCADVPDDKFGAEKTCRVPCEDCVGDLSEVCDGVNDSCPTNVVLDENLCLKAGQHYDAGDVTIRATETASEDGKLQVCITIGLDSEWSLQAGTESLKLYYSTTESPTSNPGSYSIKELSAYTQTTAGLQYCFLVDTLSADMLYFALHADVTGPAGNGETAWAMACRADDDDAASWGPDYTSDAIIDEPFTKAHKRHGVVRQGWGTYSTYQLCDVLNCPTECPGSDDGGEPPVDDTTDWACADGDVALVELTCEAGETPVCMMGYD